MELGIELCERGLLPDALTRYGIRRLLAARLREQLARGDTDFEQQIAALRRAPVAEATDKANEQHYEVPAGFFENVLGPNMKYSCCLYRQGNESLADAEAAMLALCCERAEIRDGQRILELGCGWGSLTLWIARYYPACHVTAVSNSASQREFILGRAAEQGISNIEVITADANEFDTAERFDRVISVEMFEHMKNYDVLMRRIAGWLREDGRLFVHVFCHRELMYPFTTDGARDWMGRWFFTGGLMPAERTLPQFQDHLALATRWHVPGVHYERTANDWLRRLDENRDAALAVLRETYGARDAERWMQRWRMFFMACAELFGYRQGSEWHVAHYLFRPKTGAADA